MTKILSIAAGAVAIVFAFTPFANAATCKVEPPDETENYQDFGLNNVHEESAVSFTVASDCTVTAVGMLLGRESGRTQDARARIWSDSGGAPGSVLATGSSITSGIPIWTGAYSSSFAWATSTFDGALTLNAGTIYWMAADAESDSGAVLVIARGGAGTAKAHDGSLWVGANNPSNTAAFVIEGTDEGASPPLPPPPPPPCGCTLHTETIVSDGTNKIGGGNAIPVATSSAWTASIPGATWIWQASSTVPNAVVAFEKSFTVVGTVLSAQLSVAADNSYKVFIDNVQVAADPAATNFTLATQDAYDLTANVTPGTHTLRIEVTNNGVFGALNPAGLLYKFEIKTCPPSPPAGIQILICNAGLIVNSTVARSLTSGNTAGGSQGGNGDSGGDVIASGKSGSYNNGGASGGSGGSGGRGGRGGVIRTGKANSTASTMNVLNETSVRVVR